MILHNYCQPINKLFGLIYFECLKASRPFTWKRLWISSNSSSVMPSSSYEWWALKVIQTRKCSNQVNSQDKINLLPVFPHPLLDVRLLVPSNKITPNSSIKVSNKGVKLLPILNINVLLLNILYYCYWGKLRNRFYILTIKSFPTLVFLHVTFPTWLGPQNIRTMKYLIF